MHDLRMLRQPQYQARHIRSELAVKRYLYYPLVCRQALLCTTYHSTLVETAVLLADAGLDSGSLDIGVSYHGFPIYTQSQDLCDATRCPIKKGPLTVKLEEPFPVITPPVRLLSQAQSSSPLSHAFKLS